MIEPGPSLLAAASFVACGLMPIPLRGKRPVVDWKKLQGPRLVEHDWDQADAYLHRWWDEPNPHNLGVLTGADVFIDEHRTRTLVVVDVDDQAARDVVENVCGWPQTPTVRTSHGWHLWFVHRESVGNRARVNGLGLDVRGAGGYVVVPPSTHPDGHVYSWDIPISWHEDGMWPPAPIPLELAEMLWPARPAVDGAGRAAPILTTKYIDVALQRELAAVSSATQGGRNDQLNRSAYALARFVRDGGLPVSTFAQELTLAASHAGLPETEIRRTLASALQGRT